MDLAKIVKDRFDAADSYLETKRPLWSEYENLLHNRLEDSLTSTSKSQVFDPVLATLALDRSARVMAQLPTGKIRNISKNDIGSAKLMNLTLDKYVIPQANAQFDFLTKCRMVDLYSNVYGNFFTLLDYDSKPNGYKGADMWLIPIRDVFPQVGAFSLGDSDFIIVRSWRTKSWFEEQAKQDGFLNMSKIIKKVSESTGEKDSMDSKYKSQRQINQFQEPQATKGDGYYQVLSMFERDRWVDYVPVADEIMRDGENPHDDGEFPVACKYSIPVLEDYFGMGDFERGKSMQYTDNSLWNLYLDACKISIFPPVLLNKKGLADKTSAKWAAAAKWLTNRPPSEVAQVLNLTPQGIQTFNNTLSAVKGSLLNMFGTTDTTLQDNQDPNFGRTPQALKMQNARENARDNVDRFYMEQFLTQVMKKMVNIMSKNMEDVQIRMFKEEIEQMAKTYKDVQEMWDEKTGKLTINKKVTGSMLYDYEIVSGSTYLADQSQQQTNLIEIFKVVTDKLQIDQFGKPTSPLIQAMEANGKEIHLDEIFTRMVANSGISDWDKIVSEKDDNPDEILNDANDKFTKILTNMGANVPEIMNQTKQSTMQPAMNGMEGGLPNGQNGTQA